MQHTHYSHSRRWRAVLAAIAAGAVASLWAEDDIITLEKFAVEESRRDPYGLVPTDETGSVFGLGQTVRETPRSISVISSELIERYDVSTINDLVAIAPGTFTSSFYGIAGQIDVRGTPGETYFRGMKRIENPGNYPTPIAASDRIDIVRGPPSPLYGPGKVGGYLNFVPKAARAQTGRYLEKPTGEVKATFGSWDKRIVTAEVGGPGEVFGKRAGYYGYVLLENSDSYYNNGFQDQLIIQTTFNIDVTPTIRIEFGEQYHYWSGTENAGWNRVTQELIDHGIYGAGQPLLNLDYNGDGAISLAEQAQAGGLTTVWVYGTPPPVLGPQYQLDPATVGNVRLDGSQVLIDSIDGGESDSFGFFFDVFADPSPDLKITSKLFIDYLDRYKHASYGFSQMQEAFSFEQKFLIEHNVRVNDWLRLENGYVAGYRYYDVQARADFLFELANRRDLSRGATPNDRTWLSYVRPDLNTWISETQSTYSDVGFGLLSNVHIGENARLMLGLRKDFFDFKSSTPTGASAENSEDSFGYSASLSYDLPGRITPYATFAVQPTPVMGQTGEVAVSAVSTEPLYDSELREIGVKAELLERKLFAGVAAYRQNRTSFDPITNTATATRSEGIEADLRFVPIPKLSITGAATFQKTVFYPLTERTIYTSPIVTGNDPAMANGGTLRATLPATLFFAERPGQPDRLFSLYGTYSFTDKLTATVGAIYTARVATGSSQLFVLPESTVVNANVSWSSGPWTFKVSVNNLTDEFYFRSLSPDSFGDLTVLPQLPINYQISIGYKF
jgi:Outer membrane receptor proteins, mostly Fe transport